MKMESMLGVFTALATAMWCGVTSAMPTDDEINKVTPIIEQLTKDDFNAMKAGTKSRAQLAESMLGYLNEAESEAAKFVLIKQAFRQYMVAGDVPKAVETFGRLDGTVDGVPNGTFGEWCAIYVTQLAKSGNADGLAEMLERTLDGGDGESAAALYKQIKPQQRRLFGAKTGGKRLSAAMDRFAKTERRQKEARSLRVAVRRKPDDTALREKLGFILVAANDWKAALKEFAQASGKLAEVAVWENTYPETKSSSLNEAAVAEFWWGRAEADKDAEVSTACRRHAAGWYQAAIDGEKITGLKKTLAEKRIAEMEKTGEIATIGGAAPTGKQPIKLSMGKGVEMELMPCPAGKFTMGVSGGADAWKPHEVTITRPFWTAKFLVTHEQWNAMMSPPRFNKTEEDMIKALGGDKAAVSGVTRPGIDEFCGKMTKKYRSRLPAGYVFRLPTEAEWEYACRANAVTGDPYGIPTKLQYTDGFPIASYVSQKVKALKSANVTFDEKQTWNIPGCTVGLKRPNKWGLYDMLGNLDELTLDLLPSLMPDGQPRKGGQQVAGMNYADAKDPLSWSEEERPFSIMRSTIYPGNGYGSSKRGLPWSGRVTCVGFRIVAGPDLIKERKLKSRAK